MHGRIASNLYADNIPLQQETVPSDASIPFPTVNAEWYHVSCILVSALKSPFNALKIASRLSTTITVNNSGILGGLYPKESGVIDDGKAVYVIMRWDKKSNAVRPVLRKLMSM